MNRLIRFFARDEPAEIPASRAGNFCFVVASTVLFLLCASLVITGIVFLCGGHMVVEIAWISAALAAAFAFWLGKRFFPARPVAAWCGVLVAVFLAFLGSMLLNRPIYDISYDGQTYQQEAVIRLSGGWNPVYQALDPAVIGGEEKWINYYPKASWINESYLYLITHEERAAKALNIVLILVSIALLYAAFTDSGMLGSGNALLMSLLLGLNPVSVYQSLSFYLDGQLCSLFLSICAIGVIMHARRRQLAFLPLLFALMIFMNLKFTALVDAAFLMFVIMLALWMKREEYATLKAFVTGGIALLIGGLVIGFSPYLTNIIRYRTPFYPLYGAGAIDLKPYNVPGNFIDKNAPEILFLSMLSQSAGVKGVGTASAYKLPFTYSPGELVAFRYPDPDEGGFGPLFGGVIIVAFAGVAALFFATRGKEARQARRAWYGAAWLLFAVLFISVVDPIASLARYVPQAYLLAIIPILLFLIVPRPWARALAYFLIAALSLNLYLMASVYVSYNISISAKISAELDDLRMRSLHEHPILVYFNEFRSTRVMLDEAGVRYAVTKNPDACAIGFRRLLPENTTEFCAE